MQAQLPGDRRFSVGAQRDVRAGELRPWEACDVEELRRTQVGVTLLRAGVDAGQVDPDGHLRAVGVLGVERQGAAPASELRR